MADADSEVVGSRAAHSEAPTAAGACACQGVASALRSSTSESLSVSMS